MTSLEKSEENMMKRKWIFVAAPIGILVFLALGGFVVQHLWNWLLPVLFGWRQITFWQAIGMLALCRILFGGLGLRGGGHRSRMKQHMQERWEKMTPEEREKFRQGMHGCWGSEPPPDSKSNI